MNGKLFPIFLETLVKFTLGKKNFFKKILKFSFVEKVTNILNKFIIIH